jgi:hypothetical protein
MWQRTSDKACAEIQRRRDQEADLNAETAPEDDLQKRSQIEPNSNPVNNLPEPVAAVDDEIGPNDPTLEQVLDPNYKL